MSSLTAAFVALAAVAFATDRTVSVADCSFVANRDEFLGRQSRDRREIYQRVRKLKMAAVGAPVSADTLAHRNFIDQQIFGKLIKNNLHLNTYLHKRPYLD